MNDTAFELAEEVDVILFLIEATSKEIGPGDRRILEKIKESNKKTILIINKIDLVKKEELLALIKLYSAEYDFTGVLPISAIKQDSTEVIIAIFSPTNEFINVDFPTFVLPIIDTNPDLKFSCSICSPLFNMI